MTDSATEVQQIARLAGVDLPTERGEALAVPMRGMQDAARQLASIDYGDAEPSGRFRAPRPKDV